MVLAAVAADGAYSQELRLATFQETAQIMIDRAISGNITASVTLQSTSNQEIRIPDGLNRQILDNPRITSVILTNLDGCGILGVSGQSCILVNVVRAPEDTNIIKIQQAAKENGDTIIDELNLLLDTDAAYHSSYLHHRDSSGAAAAASGASSGADMVSAVYAMSQEETQSMYQKIAALVLDRRIRDAGGFFDAADSLAAHENSYMTLSIVPVRDASLFQLRVSSEYPGADDTDRFSLLDFLQVDRIERSGYFAGGFYPINSVIQIVVLSPEEIKLHDVSAATIPSTEVNGEMIPTELGRSGWIFESMEGTKIEGRYIFGTETSADSGELSLALAAADAADAGIQVGLDESVAIAAIIAIFAAAAAGFYLKGYRRGP